ncbi:HD domain-containing protein [Flavobacterium sp. UBA6135]|uniref:HD domain-containing protein n=1 Tax=Flavobacterium sp. UBA6135 TaxID=1946553 RepID=UPI0025BE2E04|nr:HD domain-containing protein [Flavobacterium sp. UBA6135]
MSHTNKLKIFNDPIYGFITIPNEFIFDLVQHPYFQRLRRVSQMGLSYLVYPGAHHTRFHHALGAMHLMQKAVEVLRFKGVALSKDEETALYCAILLHDIGHGPFSHALEQSIVENLHHEALSLLFMNRLNVEFEGKLSLAIQIFKGDYHRKFMLQLISSQLDMDRMDYLKRDSFYSGVAEGNINSDRLIQMLNVVNDELVLEEKAIYSIEKFLMARRLMYWQAYLHKTSLVAELMLIRVFKRAKELLQKGTDLSCSKPLKFFLQNRIEYSDFNNDTLDQFAQLDDFDIISAIKVWQHESDFILSSLSRMLLHRDLLKIKVSNDKFEKESLTTLKQQLVSIYPISLAETDYFIFKGKIKTLGYNKAIEPIKIVKKDRKVEDVVVASDQLNSKAFSKPVTKFYSCFPKVLTESSK